MVFFPYLDHHLLRARCLRLTLEVAVGGHVQARRQGVLIDVLQLHHEELGLVGVLAGDALDVHQAPKLLLLGVLELLLLQGLLVHVRGAHEERSALRGRAASPEVEPGAGPLDAAQDHHVPHRARQWHLRRRAQQPEPATLWNLPPSFQPLTFARQAWRAKWHCH